MIEVVNKFIKKIMIIFIIFLITAASYHGFFSKWAFRDSPAPYSIDKMIDGSAYRPYVYRRLLPSAALLIEKFLPSEVRIFVIRKLQSNNFLFKTYHRASMANSDYMLTYYLIYGMSFLCFFLGILVLRQICIDVTQDRVASTLAPLVFALVFPLLETMGGYYYDTSELLFIVIAIALASRGWWIMLLLLVPFAELNKESFLFFIPTLYPFLRRKKDLKLTTGVLVSSILVAGFTYIGVKGHYTGNPGGMVEWHLVEQIKFFLNPSNYLRLEDNYGIRTGQGFFIFHILFVLIIVRTAWSKLQGEWKIHTWIAMAINVPLFLAFCAPGELRDFSLMYTSFVVMLSIFISEKIRYSTRPLYLSESSSTDVSTCRPADVQIEKTYSQ